MVTVKARSSGSLVAKSLLAFIAGLMLVLAFAPFNFAWAGLCVPALVFTLWRKQNWRQAAITGWFFGLGLFGLGVSWVFASIHHYGHAPIWLAGIITVIFTCLLALLWAAQGAISNAMTSNKLLRVCLAYPTTWVLFEWLRSWLLTGFPWLLLGYSQLSTPLKWYAPIGSVYLVSWLLLLLSAFLLILLDALVARRTKPAVLALLPMAIIVGGALLLSQLTMTHPNGNKLKVALVQGNIAPSLSWSQQRLDNAVDVYLAHTISQPSADLIVWPESALPDLKRHLAPMLSQLNYWLQSNNSALILGLPSYQNGQFYNSAYVLGEGKGSYNKRHLVPFGEYIPFKFILNPLIKAIGLPASGLASGAKQQEQIMIKGKPATIWICYESAFAQQLRQHFNHSQLLITISDDAWFGHSLGQWQHAQMARMRALETGRYMLVATNTGITAIDGPDGTVQRQLAPFTRQTLHGQVQPRTGATIWLQFGLWPWLVLWLLLLALLILARISNHPLVS